MHKPSDDWEKPLRELNEGIEKLKDLSEREPDEAEKAAIQARIIDIEARRDEYGRVISG